VSSEAPTRLARRLGLRDAVVLGLGSMLGAGVFAAFTPAAEDAGGALLVALALAAAVALANALASAELAALMPESGGTYAYGRARLGPFWGFLAGWAFVVGKTASLAAMALTVGSYALPDHARPVAIAAVVALAGVNLLGITKTALATRVLVALVLGTLAFTVAAALLGGEADPGNLRLTRAGAWDVLGAAGFLFFAFAGYARIATLGEEVRQPARTIPRAIGIAFAVALAVYAAVAVALLLVLGPAGIAAAPDPLARAVEEALGGGGWVVRAGGAVAGCSVLLALLAGVSRTMFAMAANGDLPRPLARVHPVRRVPDVAEVTVAVVVVAVVALADLRQAIGFSSVTVLAYYAIANACSLTLRPAERRFPRVVPVAGLIGCLALAVALPWETVLTGAGVLAAGALVWISGPRRRGGGPAPGPAGGPGPRSAPR
jgi:APA family basic amino acid/polyamine antiporter